MKLQVGSSQASWGVLGALTARGGGGVLSEAVLAYTLTGIFVIASLILVAVLKMEDSFLFWF